MSTPTKVRTRIAPSPTGEYHIGHLRTCLYDYALARKYNGRFIIRIEDTDQKRYVPGAVDRILQVIKDYGLTWDEGPDIGGPYGPYVQTQRLDTYRTHIQTLIANGHAYYCFCTPERLQQVREVQKAAKKIPKYDRHCLNLTPQEVQAKLAAGEPHVIRLKMPDNEIVEFDDLIRGKIKVNTNDLDDQILIKSDGIPTYHFAVVVDDHLMDITHIFRGEEWIPSTPKQILLYRFLNWPVPVFAHLTVLMDPDGRGKMSKRHGSVSARSFLDEGYLPEAMLNFLMLLGWNPGTDRELFTLDEFVQEFSLDKLHKKSPIFDRKKLDYFNGVYIRQKSDTQLAHLLGPFIPQASPDQLLKIASLVKERIRTLKEAVIQTRFLFEDVPYDVSLLTAKVDAAAASLMLSSAKSILKNYSQIGESDVQNIKDQFMQLIAHHGWKVGDFFMVFRIAVTGAAQTPPIVESLPLMKKSRIISRLVHALDLLSSP